MTKAEREAEAEAVRKEIPSAPSEAIKADFMEEEYENVRSIFRSEFVPGEKGKKVKAVGVTCGYCRAKSFFPYQKITYKELCHAGYACESQDEYGFFDEREKILLFSGRLFHCPFCGRQSSVYGFARMKYQSIAHYVRSAQEIRAVHGHTVVIHWKLYKSIDRDGNESFWFDRENAVFQVGGRMFRATGYEYWGQARYCINGWRILLGGFREGIGGITKNRTYWNPDELAGTPEANDGFFAYLRYGEKSRYVYAERYLDLWAKAPVVENLAKTYPRYTEGLIALDTSRTTIYKKAQRLLNLKKRRPHEIIGLEKEEAKEITEKAAGPEHVYLIRLCRQNKIPLTKKILFTTQEGQAREFNEFLNEDVVKQVQPPFAKLLNYWLAKRHTPDFAFYRLRDYWQMASVTEGAVTTDIMFPKKLKEAHDREQERFQAAKNKAKNDAIKRRAKSMEKYIFKDPETGLFIRPAASCGELTREGRDLHNCVASYIDRVAEGKTSIFFIRKISDPKTSFFTLEFRAGSVIQNRGMKNCARTNEVVKFEKKWLDFIKKGNRKNGKQTATATA